MRPPPDIAALLAKETDLAAAWRAAKTVRDPAQCWQRCLDAGVSVVGRADPRYPPQLLDDPGAPQVLFARGDLAALDARRVGIVGTRNATQRGRETAAQFGYELSARGRGRRVRPGQGNRRRRTSGCAGVRVGTPDRGGRQRSRRPVSEAARRAVVAASANAAWCSPSGHPARRPTRFRFPLRNRILAALVEVLVVVESRERGGSLITAREAADRGVDVFAVPGPVDSRASAGTNQLLCDGAAPATNVDELMMALGLDHRRAGRSRVDRRPPPHGQARDVVRLCVESRPGPSNSSRCSAGLELGEAAMTLARLEHQGWLRETGGWFETIDAWGDLA